MRNSTARFLSSVTSATVLASGAILCTSVSGGAQAPLPGDNPPIDIQGDPSAPMPGAGPSPYTAPPPQAGRIGSASQAQPAHKGSYAQLPLNLTDAKNKVAQLRGLLTTARPQEMEAAIDHMNEWLSDIQDAHNKMANAFSKQDATKPEAAAEKQAANSFWQLKHQVQLIKAELLISQHRYPEALGPLVDIVVAEPVSATGKKAYDKLKELGFSQTLPAPADVKAATPAASPGGPAPATTANAGSDTASATTPRHAATPVSSKTPATTAASATKPADAKKKIVLDPTLIKRGRH